MPDLRAIVHALLVDLITAQDQANRLTRRLAKQYRQDAVLQYLPAPNAVIDEVELTLRYAVDSVDREDEGQLLNAEGQDYVTPNRTQIGQLASRIAGLVADGLADEIKPSSDGELLTPGDSASDDPDRLVREQLLASLAQSSTRDALAAHIGAALRETLSGPEPPRGSFGVAADPVEQGLDEIARRLSEALNGDEHFKEVVGNVDELVRRVLDQCRDQLTPYLSLAVSQPLAGEGKPIEKVSIGVILDGTTLASLPEQAIQTIKLHLDLRGYRSVPESEDIHIIPEDR